MPKASESILINAPFNKVYDVVTNFENYPEVFDEVMKTKVIKKRKGLVEVEFEFKIIMIISCTLKFHLGAKKISWELIKGDFMRSNNGAWIFEIKSDKKTKATYEVEIEPSMFVPSSVIEQLIKSNAPLMIKNLKKRCESQ